MSSPASPSRRIARSAAARSSPSRARSSSKLAARWADELLAHPVLARPGGPDRPHHSLDVVPEEFRTHAGAPRIPPTIVTKCAQSACATGQLALTLLGELVDPPPRPATAAGVILPRGPNQPRLLQAVEDRIQRPLLQAECPAPQLLEATQDLEAMRLAPRQGRQHHPLQVPTQCIAFNFLHGPLFSEPKY